MSDCKTYVFARAVVQFELLPDGSAAANGWPLESATGIRHRGALGPRSRWNRATLRRQLRDRYGVELPRGANPGHRWAAAVEGPLRGTFTTPSGRWTDHLMQRDLNRLGDFDLGLTIGFGELGDVEVEPNGFEVVEVAA